MGKPSDENKKRKAENRKRRFDDPMYRFGIRKTDNAARKIRRLNPDYRKEEYNKFNDRLKRLEKVYNSWCSEGSGSCHSCHAIQYNANLKRLTSKSLVKVNEDIIEKLRLSDESLLCNGCMNAVRLNRIPRLSHIMMPSFTNVPECILDLNELEARLVSPRLAFATIKAANYEGQKKIVSNYVNIPLDTQQIAEKLPRKINDSGLYLVGLKKRYQDKFWYVTDYVRPEMLRKALEYLVETPLYKGLNIKIDHDWFTENNTTRVLMCVQGVENSRIIFQDPLEIEAIKAPKLDQTMVDFHDNEYMISLSPGKLNTAKSLLFDNHAEELSFVKIFAGYPRILPEEQDLGDRYASIVRYELRNKDRRHCDPTKLLLTMKKLHLYVLMSRTRFYLKTTNANITASQLKTKEHLNRLLTSNDAYCCFGSVRNTPFYYHAIRTKLRCMIRQFGTPTFFVTLSSADTRWPELLKDLIFLSTGKKASDDDIKKLSYNERCDLIVNDPVTCARFFNEKVKAFIRMMKHAKGPFSEHPLKHYLFRVEFQHRGSPHIHGLIWLDKAPIYNGNNSSEISAFIDKYISTNSDLDVNSLQKHSHTKIGCMRNNYCRFHFPQFPMDETMVLTPLNETDYSDEDLKNLDLIKQRIGDCEITDFDDFLQDINLTKEQYIRALRASIKRPRVFIKRKPCDVMVNNFNSTILSLHNANMDIQFALDPYSILTYCTNYVGKLYRGVSSCLDKALKQIGKRNIPVKDALYSLCGYYLHYSEISAQEAAWYLLGQAFVYSNCTDIYVPTVEHKNHHRMTKKIELLEQLPDDSTDVFVDGLLEHYKDRPECLNSMCLADFAAKTEFTTTKKYTAISEVEEDIVEEDLDGNLEANPSQKCLPLKTNKGYVILRDKPKVIRYKPIRRDDDPDSYKMQQVMLYVPWTNEDILDDKLYIENTYTENVSEIWRKILDYNPNYDEKFENKMEELFQNIEAETDIDIAEDNPNLDYNIDFNDCKERFQQDIGESHHNDVEIQISRAPISDRLVMKAMVENLNEKQRIYFTIACRNVRLTEKFHHFVTGGAGTGKSHLLKVLYTYLSFIMKDDGENSVLLVAPTGKAASNIGAITLHSCFFLPLNQQHSARDQLLPLNTRKVSEIREKLKNLRVLIIDEISMVGRITFNHINNRLRQIMGINEDFGGVSIICFGDLNQLPPISDFTIYSQFINPRNPLSILSHRDLLWEKFKYYELTEIMRQKDDLKFAQALKNFASDSMRQSDIQLLKSRIVEQVPAICGTNCMRLAYTNELVSKLNREIMEKIDGQMFSCLAEDKITKKLNHNSSDKELLELAKKLNNKDAKSLSYVVELKYGANYMVLRNIDVARGIVNGTIGTLLDVKYQSNRIVSLQLRDIETKHIFELERSSDYIVRSTYTVLRKQFPVTGAHAITIHKSQGSTYDQILIYVPKRIPSKSLLYVALSRVRTLDGLYIIGDVDFRMKTSQKIRNELERLHENPVRNLILPFNIQFKCIFYNIQSWRRNRFEIFSDSIAKLCPIICLAETLTLSEDDLSIDGYNIVEHIVSNQRKLGSGMLLYIRSDICSYDISKRIYDKDGSTISSIKIVHDNQKMIFVYCSPNTNISMVAEFIGTELHQNFTIIGDFNIECRESYKLAQQMNQFNLRNIMDYKIATTDAGTYIDGVYSNVSNLRGLVYESTESYHRPIIVYSNNK